MTKDEYIITVAEAVKSKSTCPQDQVGAVFISDDHEILSTGYNGAPRGLPHCKEGCEGKCPTSVHAEANAIVQAAKRGSRLEGSTLFVTRFPCAQCAMLIVNLRVKEVVSWGKRNPDGEAILRAGGIQASTIERPEGR